MAPYVLSHEEYQKSNFVIYLVIIPIICVAGIVGNSFSLYILRANPTKVAFCTYLKALTCSDTVLLACALLRCVFRGLEEADIPIAQQLSAYGQFIGIMLGSLLQRLSSALITVIAIERVLVVVYPIKVRSMVIETKPARINAVFAVFFTLIQLPSFAVISVSEVDLSFLNTSGNNTPTIMYSIQRTKFAKSSPEVVQAYLFSLSIIGTALPLFIVIVSTVIILLHVKMLVKGISSRRLTGGSIEIERMTLTLVTMAIFFTMLSVPAVTIYVWSAYDRSPETKYLRYLFTDVNIILVCINSACDFIIYCLASNKFRSIFAENICRIARKSQTTITSVSTTSSITPRRAFLERTSSPGMSWVDTDVGSLPSLQSATRIE